MTVAVPSSTPKTSNLSPGSKRRRLLPLSPTSHDSDTRRYVSPPDMPIPSIPSLSKIDGNSSIELTSTANRPRQRTESFDEAFRIDMALVSPTVGQVRPRSNSSEDHCIDHTSFNKRRPPFVAKESDTFAAFTKPAKGTTFGASSSFIGLRGLLPEDSRASQCSLTEAASIIRRNSSIGLDMSRTDDTQSEPKRGEE